jgi:putative tryptophan/tyrosine transport system substrate-binding protein
VDRRDFLMTSLAGIVVQPLVAWAQKPGKATLGVLTTTRLTEPLQRVIREGLAEHGYVDGQNIVIEWRAAEAVQDRAPALARELVQRKVDVIIAVLTPATQAAKDATSTIPIVMAPAGEPVGSGFATSLARPGGNITGVTGIGAELSGKQLEALRQLVPRLTRVALLINPAGEAFSKSMTEQTAAAAKRTGIVVDVVSVSRTDELERAFKTIADRHDDGVIVQGPIFIPSFPQIARLGLRHRLASVSAPKEFAEAGGLLAYGASQMELTRRAMFYVARILRGAKPADLPIEQPTKFELAINVKTAKALGLTIPPSLLARTDQLIE